MRHKMDIIEAFATKNKCYKAYDNAVYPDITPDEVTAYQEAAITTQQQIPTAGFGDKLRVYVESIPTAYTPTVPLEWFAGIRVAKGYHYTNGVDVALAVADGVPATFEDERFLVKL